MPDDALSEALKEYNASQSRKPSRAPVPREGASGALAEALKEYKADPIARSVQPSRTTTTPVATKPASGRGALPAQDIFAEMRQKQAAGMPQREGGRVIGTHGPFTYYENDQGEQWRVLTKGTREGSDRLPTTERMREKSKVLETPGGQMGGQVASFLHPVVHALSQIAAGKPVDPNNAAMVALTFAAPPQAKEAGGAVEGAAGLLRRAAMAAEKKSPALGKVLDVAPKVFEKVAKPAGRQTEEVVVKRASGRVAARTAEAIKPPGLKVPEGFEPILDAEGKQVIKNGKPAYRQAVKPAEVTPAKSAPTAEPTIRGKAKTANPEPAPAVAASTEAPHGTDVTSARKASMAQDLSELFGKEPPPDNAYRGWEEDKATALSKGHNTHENAVALSERGKNGEQLSSSETAGIALRANEIKQKLKGLRGAQGDLSGEDLLVNQEAQKILEGEFYHHAEGLKASKGEVARSLASQKMTIDKDYDLVSVKTRARAANDGKPLDPKREAQYNEAGVKHDELNSRIAALEKEAVAHKERISSLEADNAIKRMQKDADLTARRGARAKQVGDIKTRRSEIEERIGKRLGRLQSGIPADIVSDVGALAKTYVEEGVTKAADLVDAVHSRLSNFIEDLDKRDVRDAISGYGKTARPVTDPAAKALAEARKQMRLMSSLEDAQAGKAPEKSGFQRGPESEEVKALRQQVKDEMLKQGLKEPAKPLSEASVLRSMKTRLQNQIMELEGKVARKDTSPAVRQVRKTPIDVEVDALKKQRAGLQVEMERMIASEKKPAPSDYVNAFQRFAILSGLNSLQKIGYASILRTASNVGEGLVSDQIARLPVMRDIAAKAPGATPISWRGHINSFVDAWKSPKDMWQKAVGEYTRGTDGKLKRTPGKSVMERAYFEATGKHPDIKPTNAFMEVMELPGQVHGAIKLPAQRTAWEQGMRRRAAFELKAGNDLADPGVQVRVVEGAYNDSLEAIFRGDNMVVDAWNRGVGTFKQFSEKGTTRGHRAAATIAKVGAGLELPIVRIPTNLISESLLYTPAGLGRAALEVLGKNSIKNMTPEQASIVMKATTKGAIGTAISAAVWYSPNGVKVSKKSGDLGEKYEKGDMMLFGQRIPNNLTHHPAIMAMKTTASMRDAYNNVEEAQEAVGKRRSRNAYQKAGGLVSAAAEGIRATAEEVPFLSDIPKVAGALRGESGMISHVKKVGQSFVPVEARQRLWPYKKKAPALAGKIGSLR